MKKVVGVLVALVFGGSAVAQTIPQTGNLERFNLNPSGNGSLVMANGELLPSGVLRGGVLFQYANNLALTRRLEGAGATTSFDRLSANVGLAFGITDWLEADLQVPIVLSQGRGLPPSLALAFPNSALGQPTLSLRGGMAEGELLPLSFSLEVGASLPLGGAAALVGQERPSPIVRLNAGKNFDGVNVFGEISFVERVDVGSFGIRQNVEDRLTDELGLGIGVSSHLIEKLSGEAAAQFAFDIKTPGAVTQLHLGLRYAALGNVELFAAGGPAFGSLMATPDWRLFAGLAISGDPGKEIDRRMNPPPPPDPCADPATATVEGCPENDADTDGIVNKIDNCPNDAEDKDGFADEDGCVDPDNDGDAVADADDKCPGEAGLERLQGCPIPDQDKDGIADADDKCPSEYGLVAQAGCPIKDDDSDGIVNKADACPTEAGLMELKGCAAKDGDTDGIADHLDNCPTEKGLANNSGCPAKKKQFVVITKDKLEIKDRIYFGNNNARIQRRSNKLLNQVAEIIQTKPQIEKVIIEGHSDDRGPAERNRKLSLDRAEAVKSYLVRQGVDVAKLETKGIGPDKPIDTNKTNAGRANNRRVEFIVVQPEPAETM